MLRSGHGPGGPGTWRWTADALADPDVLGVLDAAAGEPFELHPAVRIATPKAKGSESASWVPRKSLNAVSCLIMLPGGYLRYPELSHLCGHVRRPIRRMVVVHMPRLGGARLFMRDRR